MLDIKRLILSFIIGGVICITAQILIDLTRLTPARILVFTVCLGVALGASGIYGFLFNIAGAGVSVPLLGFGANIAEGVREAIDKDGILGILKGPFSAASVGCTSALLFGFISCLAVRGSPKRSR